MMLKKPISKLNLLGYLAAILCLEGLAYANSVPRVITGFVVEKRDSILMIQQGKKTLVPINVNDIATLAVLDSRKLSRGVLGAMALGAGSGLGIGLINGNGPRNSREVFQRGGVGAGLGFILKGGWNWLTRKEPQIIFHVNGAGTADVEIIKNILPGTKVRITSKNNL